MSTQALAAFNSFDWESSAEWKAYLINIEVPAGREDALNKVKAKWFKRVVDSNLDLDDVVKPTTSTSSSHTIPDPAPQPTSSGREATPPRSEPRSAATGRAAAAGTATKLDAAALQSFVLHLSLIILAVVYVIPFHRWSRPAYRYFNMMAIVTQANKILTKHGFPTFRPLSGLKDWAVRVVPTTDFQYMMMAVMFMPQPPMTMAIVPALILAVYYVFAFASQHLPNQPAFKALWEKYGVKAHQWLITHQQDALVANATAEISVGFMLIAQLLTPARNFILLYLFWNMLKMRYWSRDASAFHRKAWQALNARTKRYRDMLPIVEKPIGYVVKWFNTQR